MASANIGNGDDINELEDHDLESNVADGHSSDGSEQTDLYWDMPEEEEVETSQNQIGVNVENRDLSSSPESVELELLQYSRSQLLMLDDFFQIARPPTLSRSRLDLVSVAQSQKPWIPKFQGTLIQRIQQAEHCIERANYDVMQDMMANMTIALIDFVVNTFDQMRRDILSAGNIQPTVCFGCSSKRPAVDAQCVSGVCNLMVNGVLSQRRGKPKPFEWTKSAYQLWSLSTKEIINVFLPGTTPVNDVADLDLAALLYAMSICRVFQQKDVPPNLCLELLSLRNEVAHSNVHLVADETLMKFVEKSIDLLDRIPWPKEILAEVQDVKVHLLERVREKPDYEDMLQNIAKTHATSAAHETSSSVVPASTGSSSVAPASTGSSSATPASTGSSSVAPASTGSSSAAPASTSSSLLARTTLHQEEREIKDFNANVIIIGSSEVVAPIPSLRPQSGDPMKLYVTGFGQEMTCDDLQLIFPTAGIISIPLSNKDTVPIGRAIVHFGDEASAQRAHDKNQGLIYRNQLLTVTFAPEDPAVAYRLLTDSGSEPKRKSDAEADYERKRKKGKMEETDEKD